MLQWKKAIAIGVALFAIGTAGYSQERDAGAVDRSAFDDLSVSLAIEQLKGDFGMEARIVSPYFLWDRVAISAGADILWRDGPVDADPADHAWTPYWAYRLGVLSGTLPMENGIRLYGFGGALLAISDERFDADAWAVGGYGGFGFEFLIEGAKGLGSSYFIELGSTGIDLRADRMPGDPIYMNGFSAKAGFRAYF